MNVCPVCYTLTQNKTFCTLVCANNYRSINNFVLRKKHIKNCEYCGYKFSYRDSRQTFCSHSCAATRNNTGKIRKSTALIKPLRVSVLNRWLRGEHVGHDVAGCLNISIRDYLIKRADYRCQECGWGRLNVKTGKIPLTISHRDGDWSNCHIDNLDVLCPNCHSLTDSYGNLNKGKGRPLRHKRHTTVG